MEEKSSCPGASCYHSHMALNMGKARIKNILRTLESSFQNSFVSWEVCDGEQSLMINKLL